MTTDEHPRPLLTVDQAAALAGVTPQTIRRWARVDGLPVLQPAGPHGAVRIDRHEPRAFLQRDAP